MEETHSVSLGLPWYYFKLPGAELGVPVEFPVSVLCLGWVFQVPLVVFCALMSPGAFQGCAVPSFLSGNHPVIFLAVFWLLSWLWLHM